MTTFSQQPGSMGLSFRGGDEVSTQVDFDISLSGYTVTSQITSLVTGGPVQAITTTLTNASAGQVNISLTEAQTAALPAGTYAWEMVWVAPGGVTRTALIGTCEVT
jgi:hypothetical protein